jgi:hypothetical protein
MPSSVGSALLLFGIVLALANAPTVAIIAGAAGVAFELLLFFGDATG